MNIAVKQFDPAQTQPAVKTTTQILAEAIEAAANHSTTHMLSISETSTHPFVFDEESGVCLDAAGNLCIAMIVKNTDISIYFKTAAHGELERFDQEVTPHIDPQFDHYHDITWHAHKVDKDALCCVIQAVDVQIPEGTLFRLTEAQAWRINEALAEFNVDATHVVPHA